MKNILDKVPDRYKEETRKKLADILISQDPWIKEGIKNRGLSITGDTKFLEDLGMDSLDTYEYAYKVMENFAGVHISDEKISEFETIGDYISYIFLEDCLSNKR